MNIAYFFSKTIINGMFFLHHFNGLCVAHEIPTFLTSLFPYYIISLQSTKTDERLGKL